MSRYDFKKPSTSSIAQPSATTRPSQKRSSTSVKDDKGKTKEPAAECKEPEPEEPLKPGQIRLPAFSIGGQSKFTEMDFQKLKGLTKRKSAPPGENIPELKKILAAIKKEPIGVTEYVATIAPFTGDGAGIMRQTMTDDMTNFKNTVRKVYETMTQDVSDVLTNQQVQLEEFNQERHQIYSNKMMACINEIYELCPDFSFELYYKNKDKYLSEKFPLPDELQSNAAEVAKAKRLHAYHRLQWLRSENTRLQQENANLQKKLNQLKKQQQEELMLAEKEEAEVEEERDKLRQEETAMEKRLNELGHQIEVQIAENEKEIRISEDKEALRSTKPGAVEEVRSRRPIKSSSAPQKPPREKSPFHFSPIKTPPGQPRGLAETTRMEHSESKVESKVQDPKPPEPCGTRRAQGPKDTWGGFN